MERQALRKTRGPRVAPRSCNRRVFAYGTRQRLRGVCPAPNVCAGAFTLTACPWAARNLLRCTLCVKCFIGKSANRGRKQFQPHKQPVTQFILIKDFPWRINWETSLQAPETHSAEYLNSVEAIHRKTQLHAADPVESHRAQPSKARFPERLLFLTVRRRSPNQIIQIRNTRKLSRLFRKCHNSHIP